MYEVFAAFLFGVAVFDTDFGFSSSSLDSKYLLFDSIAVFCFFIGGSFSSTESGSDFTLELATALCAGLVAFDGADFFF